MPNAHITIKKHKLILIDFIVLNISKEKIISGLIKHQIIINLSFEDMSYLYN